MLKKVIAQSLSPEKVDRLRRAKQHFNDLVDALFHSPANEIISGRNLFQREGKTFLQLARSCPTNPADDEHEAVKRSLMERVAFDERYNSILKTRHMRSLIRDHDIYNCVLAAARYACGEVEEAIALFESAIQANPTPFNYLCLSRCASHGLGDDNRALTILNTGLQRFPGDFSLILSKATVHFRLGETKRANDYLASVNEDLAAIVRASEPDIDQLEAEISTAIAHQLTVRPEGPYSPTYSEEHVEVYWELVWYHMNALSRFQHGWAGLNHLYEQQIGSILTEIPDIRSVINFGVFCAQPDYSLAKQFPETMFFGVDLQKRTKELNENAYQAPNLNFLAADIMDVLPELSRKGSPSLLFHARTGTLLYPDLLRAIYGACASAGVEYIALWENSSLSRTTLRFHDFENMPADSIPYLSVMFIHNYKKILEEKGYRLIKCERLPSNIDLLEETKFLGDGHAFVVAKRA